MLLENTNISLSNSFLAVFWQEKLTILSEMLSILSVYTKKVTLDNMFRFIFCTFLRSIGAQAQAEDFVELLLRSTIKIICLLFCIVLAYSYLCTRKQYIM